MVWLLILSSCIEQGPVEALPEPAGEPEGVTAPVTAPERTYSLCACCTWGVTGVDPGPDYQPPPLPEACKEVLKAGRQGCVRCPLPP